MTIFDNFKVNLLIKRKRSYIQWKAVLRLALISQVIKLLSLTDRIVKNMKKRIKGASAVRSLHSTQPINCFHRIIECWIIAPNTDANHWRIIRFSMIPEIQNRKFDRSNSFTFKDLWTPSTLHSQRELSLRNRAHGYTSHACDFPLSLRHMFPSTSSFHYHFRVCDFHGGAVFRQIQHICLVKANLRERVGTILHRV